MDKKNLLPKDGELYYYPNFLGKEAENHLFDVLKQGSLWEQEEIKLFGKRLKSPRLTSYYGTKAYTYSSVPHPPKAYPKVILELMARIESEHRLGFNSVLLNFYRDGQDSMGWHQDNEGVLGKNPAIASINLGATRKFSFKHCTDKQAKVNVLLEGGSLLLMKGSIQHYWKHQLPKTSLPVGERINLTFRCIV